MPVLIEINNSFSQVKNCTLQQFSELKKILSYTEGSFFSGRPAYAKYLLSKDGHFLTGLLPLVKDHFVAKRVDYIVIDKRILPSYRLPLKANIPFAPYADQLRAADCAVNCHRGILSSPTGTGKSLMIALIIKKIAVKTLIVVPSVEIKLQLTETLTQVFGKLDTKQIRVENIDSPSLKTATDYDCLIIDEAHHVAARSYQKLNKLVWKNIYYRFFLTATPYRNQSHETMLFTGIAGEVIFRLSYRDAVKKKYIVPVEAYYVVLEKKQVEGFTYTQVYNELVVNNLDRNKKIAELLDNLQDFATLCLVKEIEHGNNIGNLITLPFVNGKDEESRKYIKLFNDCKVNRLIGTAGILGEGVDTKPAEFIIIADLGKSKGAFMQKVGRGVRTFGNKSSAKIILFKDPSHKFTVRHFNAQVKILKEEYGIKPTRLF